MNNENIALELLVRTGKPDAVEAYADSKNVNESTKNEKIAEAGIYSAILIMREDAEGGIDSEKIVPFLSQEKFSEYFSKTKNTSLLIDIVDVLKDGTQAMMEAYAQITAIDVLGVESLENALKKNLHDDELKEKLTKLVHSGYSLAFCPHDIDENDAKHYFQIIDRYRSLADVDKLVEGAVYSICENADDNLQYLDYAGTAIENLLELTDRETISKLIFDKIGETKLYDALVNNEKIDRYESQERSNGTGAAKIDKAIKEYEKYKFPSQWNVKRLYENVGEGYKEHLGNKLGEWFSQRKPFHAIELSNFENGMMYDAETAKKSIGVAIEQAIEKKDIDLLEFVMKLPENLIDKENAAISAVAEAYKFSSESQYSE